VTGCSAWQVIKRCGALPHHNASVRQGCVTPVLPCGFILKLVIWNSWADPFYVGLTGIEVHDAVNGPVAVSPSRISAMPFSSVAILPNMSNDARTPDKLVRLAFPSPTWLPLECDVALHAKSHVCDEKRVSFVMHVEL
jgi:hypothetical protein